MGGFGGGPRLEDEEARLHALARTGLLDTPPEPPFDQLVAQAAAVCDAPIAMLTLVDRDRQWFKARLGMPLPETPRAVSFCAHAIAQQDPLVVPDAMSDERFAENPLVVAEPSIRSYAGAAVRTADGQPIGTMCVVDQVPRELSAAQVQALRLLAEDASTLIELRRRLGELVDLPDVELRAQVARETVDMFTEGLSRRGALLTQLVDAVDRDAPHRLREALVQAGSRTAMTVNIGAIGAVPAAVLDDLEEALDATFDTLARGGVHEVEITATSEGGTVDVLVRLPRETPADAIDVPGLRSVITHLGGWVGVSRDATGRTSVDLSFVLR